MPGRRGNPNWAKDPATGKGKSGNPGGRPKTAAELRGGLANLTDRTLARLTEMLESENEKIAIQAVRIVIEYVLGKPATIDPNGEVVRETVINVSIPDALKRDA